MILPPGLPVEEGIRPTAIILFAHSSVYVVGGGNIINIVSPTIIKDKVTFSLFTKRECKQNIVWLQLGTTDEYYSNELGNKRL